MLVVGTAGHIDHGKSSIVKRLTGTDPDRLPEEKARGLTIDLGFAFYQTPDNDTIAFVDVPGHERFVKNMVAGAGGVDAVMLVVAADDGWMPQSEEHFQIVRLLGVRRGLIVINKSDLVESDWLELLESDIREKVRGTFLEKAPVITVSAQTGQGFDLLKSALDMLPSQVAAQRDIGRARLYIDRSFVRPGIGGVVTGTLRGGKLSLGQTVSVWPAMKQAKIRSLHSNNREVEMAVPGQRTAVSFTGLDKEYLVRGGVISDKPDVRFFRDNPVLAVSAELLPDAAISLTQRRRVMMIVGTTEAEGEVRLFDQTELKPGQSGLVFFKPDGPVYALVGDHYIMRLPTPMVTVGGGRILDHLPRLPRRKDMHRYEYLRARLPLSAGSLVDSELRKSIIIPVDRVAAESDFSRDDIEAQVKKAWRDKKLDMFNGNVYHKEYIQKAVSDFEEDLKSYLEDKSHLKGLTPEQIVDITGLSDEQASLLTAFMVSTGAMIKVKELYNLSGRGMSLKGIVKQAHDEILGLLKADPYSPPTLTSLAGKGKAHKDAIKFIIDSSEGYKCGADFIFLDEVWEEITAFVKETISKGGRLTVADLREKFGFSRKFAIPILEETDRIRLTKREGDYRVKGERFES